MYQSDKNWIKIKTKQEFYTQIHWKIQQDGLNATKNLEPKKKNEEKPEPVRTTEEDPKMEPVKIVSSMDLTDDRRNQRTKESRVERILEPKPTQNHSKKKGPLLKNLLLEDGVISLKNYL